MTVRLIQVVALASLLAVAGCGGSSGSSGASLGSTVKAAGTPDTEVAQNADQQQQLLQAQQRLLAASALSPLRAEAQESTGSTADVDPMKTRLAKDAPVPVQVLLSALSATSASAIADRSTAAAASAKPDGQSVPKQIGVVRDVSDTATPQRVFTMLGWSPSARGGKVAALRVVSAGAQGVRVGLLVRSLPLSGTVRFYADGSDKVYEIPAQEILAAIARNVASGDTGDAAHTYWSPNLGGDAITVEFEVPEGTPTNTVQVAVPSLSHIFIDSKEVDAIAKATSGSCNRDVNCDSADYSQAGKSVALMEFVENGGTFLCSGTLLSDLGNTGQPWFLSANHCLATQTAASSLRTRWFYKSTSCGATTENPSVWLQTGAALLYTSTDTDTTFMRLNSAPPSGSVFAAWSAAPVSAGVSVFGIHHPSGDLQKYSAGTSPGLAGSCDGPSCTKTNSIQYLRVQWNAGTTEGGSSGSGLFTKIGASNYLVGQLYGGLASCTNPSGTDYYGRLDTSYAAALYQWLGGAPARAPAYRLYNNKTKTHFYTLSSTERNNTVASLPEYTYDGPAFYASRVSGDPVYRFYNTRTGAHFYTISETERANVQSQYPWFSFEGVSWYASLGGVAGSTPMYRFYNKETQTHFYTASAAERDSVQQNYPQYVYEGIGYYAWLTP